MHKQQKFTKSAKLEVTIGKGVLDKWGKYPFATRTLHITRGGFVSPVDYTMSNVLMALFDPTISGLELIDENNRRYTVSIAQKELV